MALLHHLARTGGTLISRCLASMQGVCLLSEINPLGTAHFNPLRQAAQWYGLIRDEEVLDLVPGELGALHAAMQRIRDRAAGQGLKLVVRDWAHADWVGFPFVSCPPLSFSWDRIAAVEHGGTVNNRLCVADAVEVPESTAQSVAIAREASVADPVAAIRCATVRHPIDQYLSCKRLGVLSRAWDEQAMWRGIYRFSVAIQAMPWFRYEDFLAAPDETLEQICAALLIDYDPSWRLRWVGYTRITGDAIDSRRSAIEPQERKPLSPDFWASLRGNDEFFATLELLGYPIPEPLRRQRPVSPGRQAAITQPAAECSSIPLVAVDWDGAVVRWRDALEADPHDIACGLRLARALRWIGQANEAAEVLLALIPCCDPSATDALVQLLSLACETLDKAGRKFDSIGLRRLWAQCDCNHPDNLFQLSLLLAGVGEVEESLTYSRHLLTRDRRHVGAAANFLLYLNYSDRCSAAEVSNEHFRLAMRFSDRPEPIADRRPHVDGKLRIGYLSSDFYTHPVGKIILPILQSHDSRQFVVTVYHDGKKSDANTVAIQQAVDRFTTIHGWSDQQVLETIRGDEIDVLIDLGGYTGGGNRLRVLARRAAPVQASFLGYPNTSAIQTIDYHLTDRFADPPGLTEHFYGEQLVWLDHAHLAWRPYAIADEVQVAARGNPLLGVFNNVAKISPTAIDAYASILKRVPEARIVFKYGDRYQVSVLQDRYRRQFAEHGVLPNRLEFRTRAEPLAEHLRTMMSVDLALDSFPYQGTMTSLECLAVGTPILSCCGEYYAHRATSAMMMRMRFHELVADDPGEYVEIAVQLLQELPVLRALRGEVRRRFFAGPLTDPVGLTREMETVYQGWMAAGGSR